MERWRGVCPSAQTSLTAPGPASSSHAFSAASPRSYGRSNSSTTSTGTTIVKVAMRSRDNVSSRRAESACDKEPRVSVESDLTCRPPQVASTRDSGRQATKNITLVSAVWRESSVRRARGRRGALLVSYRPLALGSRDRSETAFRTHCGRSQHRCPVRCATSQVLAAHHSTHSCTALHKSQTPQKSSSNRIND